MLEKDAWKNSFSSYFNVSEYSNKGFELYNGEPFIPQAAQDKIEKTVNRCLPPQVLYPFLERGKLGPTFLVKSYLNDIFPIGFPLEELEGHGVRLSFYGF
ncbi:MAG: hypothetical protein JNJ47_07385, partial [Alphaproteobacteria bacterium]|nr:hypothetical protein [Alphaproteobacteria bacterium]